MTRLRTTVSKLGPSNAAGLGGLVLTVWTVAEAFGRLPGQGVAAVALFVMARALHKAGA
ncbi:MAG: hypothetical protein AB7H43_14105 [Acidimicrobiia bacterium]